VVFLFQDRKTFNDFVDKGWQADISGTKYWKYKKLNQN
jgi:hypothetical protein